MTDKKDVKKIMTFKAGQFVFSSSVDREALGPALAEARVLKETINDLPVLPWLAARLDEETVRKSIYSTAAIEGNPLDEEKVGEILTQDDQKEALEIAEQEILNLKFAYNVCKSLESGDAAVTITEALIKRLHKMITEKIDHEHNVPGKYRNHLVRVSDKEHGGIYTPPKILTDIETLMIEFISWINDENILNNDPLIRAALAHYHLSLIHPFGDGNGRTARLLEAIILQFQGLKYVPQMMSNYYYLNVDEYYWAFSRSRKNKNKDVTPFVEFVVKAYIHSSRDLKNKMASYIRIMALRDYITSIQSKKMITKRQFDLLSSLLDSNTSFTVQDLFNAGQFRALYKKVSQRTAWRDVEKLTKMKLVQKNDAGKYELNVRLLDNY